MSNLVSQDTIQFDDAKLRLLRDTICKGANEDEFMLFKHVCQRTGLDPFMKQIHPVKRWDSALKRESMTFQTGIDGYRLIAERTGKYVPGRDTTYTYDENGKLFSATAYVKKLSSDGQWHEIPGTAFFKEYVAYKKDGSVTAMWETKPHIMLGKCAEALALRKAFPADLSGIYTMEEMEQSSNLTIPIEKVEKIETINISQKEFVQFLIDKDEDKQGLISTIYKTINCTSIEQIPSNRFDALVGYIKQRQEKQKTQLEHIQEAV